jgi:Ferric reductase like transmembrane component
MTLLAAAANAKTLWYLTRGTGVVALVLLTASVGVGTLSSARWRSSRVPRFLVGGMHRNLTLLAVAFVVVHVVTTVADRFAPIGFQDAVVPFLSPYRPIWLGLGSVAFDLLLALVATSVLRARLGFRMWRAVHWLAYASWPVAVLHSLGTGSDARFGWLALVTFASCAAVVVAIVVRVVRSGAAVGMRAAAFAASVAVPLALFVWYLGGPMNTGWAARAGTPSSLLHSPKRFSPQPIARVQRSLPSQTFTDKLDGRLTQRGPGANGLIRIEINARLRGDVRGRLRVTLWGTPSENGGVALETSNVAFGAAGTTLPYVGRVVGLDGNLIDARLANSSGGRVAVRMAVNVDAATGGVTGELRGQAGQS